MGRPLWFVAGAGVGVYAAARARRAAETLTADGLRDRVRGWQAGARLFAEEVQQGRPLRPLGVVADRRLVQGRDRRAEVGQVVGRGEAGDAEAGDDHADAVPLRVASEPLDAAHVPATHSA